MPIQPENIAMIVGHQDNFATQSLRAVVRTILENAHEYAWTLQGFGMLRMNIAGYDAIDYRLNVWHSAYRVKNVSLIHDHPWDFTSMVLSGQLNNLRYRVLDKPTAKSIEHVVASIKPGPGGGMLIGSQPRVKDYSAGGVLDDAKTRSTYHLEVEREEEIRTGWCYHQLASEVHLSDPADGTVTFNERHRVAEDVARVFWRVGTQWVSAEPRKATVEEVEVITQFALKKWSTP